VHQELLDDYGITRELTNIHFTPDNYELFLLSRKESKTRMIADAVGRERWQNLRQRKTRGTVTSEPRAVRAEIPALRKKSGNEQ
jgi:hypothetical protein